MILGLKRGEVRLVPHQPEWRAAFASEQAHLRRILGDAALDLEHIGSTAVPGLPAKPVIDVVIAVRSFADIAAWPALLQKAGYTYFGDREGRNDHFFAKGAEELRMFYLHVVPLASDRWSNYLKFRDTLRASVALRDDYAALKQTTALVHPGDRNAYTQAKAAWIENILGRDPAT